MQLADKRMARPSVRSIVSDCLRRSSVRGLPRIFGNDRLHLRLLWLSAVLLLFCLCLLNLLSLLQTYSRGDTLFSVSRWQPPPPFPSFTICNFLPISGSAVPLVNLTPAEFRRRILRMAAADRLPSPLRLRLLHRLLQPESYHEHLDLPRLMRAASGEQLVLRNSCHIHHAAGVTPCSDNGQFAQLRPTYVPGYANCETLRLRRPDAAVSRVTLHLLPLAAGPGVGCWYCMTENPDTLRHGAVLYLHDDSAYPADISDGLFLLPGTHNVVHVKQKRVSLVKDCSPDTRWRRLRFSLAGSRHSSSYSTQLCRQLQLADSLAALCNCSLSTLPQARRRRLPSCLQQPLGHNRLRLWPLVCLVQTETGGGVLDLTGLQVPESKQLQRQQRQLQRRQQQQQQQQQQQPQCMTPCTSVQHTVAHSSALGITHTSALAIFNSHIRRTHLQHSHTGLFHGYEMAQRMLEAGRQQRAREWLGNTTYLQENFLTVVLSFSHRHAKRLEENWVMETSSLIGQAGGALALFSGVTLICLAELADLLTRLLCHCCRRRPRDSWRVTRQLPGRVTASASRDSWRVT